MNTQRHRRTQTGLQADEAPAILCIDNSSLDQKSIKLHLDRLLRSRQIRLFFASSTEEALRILSEQLVHVALLDVDLRPDDAVTALGQPPAASIDPQHNGVYAIHAIKDLQSHIEVIMVTGHSESELGEPSKRRGALGLVEKKNLRELATHVEWAIKLADQNLSQLANVFGGIHSIPYIVGTSEQARLERARVAAAVRTPGENILIIGEPGSGKTSRAKWIHTLRNIKMEKPGRPFVNINVSAWSEGMMERELFGHRKGSFTGAISDVKGAIERADGGTLLLDEIGELPLELQCKLLKFLQERVYCPLGGAQQEARCDIIAATNRDLTRAVESGEFRQDLYERFSIVIRIAPLYERKEDLRYIVPTVLRGLRHRLPDASLNPNDIPEDLITIIEQAEIRGGYRVLENIFAALILFSPENPFSGERDYHRWKEIPEVQKILDDSRSTVSSRAASRPAAQNSVPTSPITLGELCQRSFDFVGHREFQGLAATLEMIKEKIYEDAWTKHRENKAAANALGVSSGTASPYTSRVRGRLVSAPPESRSPESRTIALPAESRESLQ